MSYDPYARAFPAPIFPLTSPDFADGGPLPVAAYNIATGQNASPALRWEALPEGTRSLFVTAFDADAPIPGGFWHWAVMDVPASLDGLAQRAGTAEHSALPAGARHLTNSLGIAGYSGARPPAGTGQHRLFFAVTALNVETLEVPDGASLALVHALIIPHTLARAVITATADAPDLHIG